MSQNLSFSQKFFTAFRKPVVVQLMGGLGNQMFQYATARAAADRIGTELFLDNSSYANDKLRHYELGAFDIRAKILTKSSLQKYSPFRNSAELEEKSMRFDSRISDLKSGIKLKGYFQTEKYFSDDVDQIRKDFTIKNKLSPYTLAVKKEIQNTRCPVSLHVRRGDYATNAHTNSYHGLAPIQYYQLAVEIVKKSFPDLHLFLFSDDPEWVANNMDMGVPQTFMNSNPPDRGFEDMYLMSLCQHHIIANSSFSWWGAWLARSPQQIVIAPKRWFQTTEIDDTDLVPEKWIRI